MRFLREIVDEERPSIDPFFHLREGKRLSYGRHAGLHHVDKGAVDPVCFRAPGNADETVCRKIQRQFLDRGVEAHVSRAPFLDLSADPPIECIGIVAHRSRLECDRQRAAVSPVVIEIHQHQPTREQPIQYGAPPLFGRKQLFAVEQDQLIGVRPDQRHVPAAKGLVLVDPSIFGDHRLGHAMRIREHFEGIADKRPAFFAWDVGKRILIRIALRPMRGCSVDGLMSGKRSHR